MPANNNISARHRERARAFQVLYSLFFSGADSSRGLGHLFARTLYSDPASPEGTSQEIDWNEDEGQTRPPLPAPPDADDEAEIFSPSPLSLGETPRGLAWELVLGAWQERKELDRLITGYSQHWRLDRMGRVELAILRLAVYELVWRLDTPPKVVLNEAIELSKEFGDDNSRAFINGILDAVVCDLEKGTLARRHPLAR